MKNFQIQNFTHESRRQIKQKISSSISYRGILFLHLLYIQRKFSPFYPLHKSLSHKCLSHVNEPVIIFTTWAKIIFITLVSVMQGWPLWVWWNFWEPSTVFADIIIIIVIIQKFNSIIYWISKSISIIFHSWLGNFARHCFYSSILCMHA